MQPKTPQTVTNLPRDCAPNVVVTGSSGALGSAIAQRLQGAGYSVHGMDLAPPPSSCAMRHHQVDLSDDASLAAAVAAVRAAAPRLGGLVHCAGVYPLVPWADYTLALWDRVHAVNVRGAFAVVTGLADCLDGGASVVLVASGAAHLGSRDVGYAASKAGLVGLMKALAMNLASRGIRVNAVCPGLIDSPMSARMAPERRRHHEQQALLGRAGTADEVAGAVAYLLSAESGYVTGATLDINGGLYLR